MSTILIPFLIFFLNFILHSTHINSFLKRVLLMTKVLRLPHIRLVIATFLLRISGSKGCDGDTGYCSVSARIEIPREMVSTISWYSWLLTEVPLLPRFQIHPITCPETRGVLLVLYFKIFYHSVCSLTGTPFFYGKKINNFNTPFHTGTWTAKNERGSSIWNKTKQKKTLD